MYKVLKKGTHVVQLQSLAGWTITVTFTSQKKDAHPLQEMSALLRLLCGA